MYNLLIADDDYNAIRATIFESKTMPKDYLEATAKEGNLVTVYGNYDFNEYSHANVFNVNKIDEIPQENPVSDDAEEKRVELHTHTKFSAMDGVSDPEDIVLAAYHCGHKAVAITDHLDVQSFRQVFNKISEIKKNDKDCKLKVLYGCEFNVVDPYLECVFNPSDINLKDATYTVFDLETTGLSSRHETITSKSKTDQKNGRSSFLRTLNS